MATKVKLISETITPTLAGGTLTGDLNFGDSDKAVFGASSDLQIYHDGSHSYIDDAGTGNLHLRGSNQLLIQNNDGTKNFFVANNANGWAKLYHDNSVKFETTSTGATVTGNLAVTGDLDITGNVNSASVTDLDVTDKTITLGAGQTEALSGGSGIVVDGSGASILWDETNDEWDFNKGLNITGNTYVNSGNGTGTAFKVGGEAGNGIKTQYVFSGSTQRNWQLGFATHISQVMSITPSSAVGNTTFTTPILNLHGANGNVGIGDSNPPSNVKLAIQADGIGLRLDGTANTTRSIFFRNTTASNPAQVYSDGSLRLWTEDAGTDIRFHTNSTGTNNERMRIDSSGNVGIGGNPHSSGRLLVTNGGTNQIVLKGASGTTNLNMGNFVGGGYISANYYYSSGHQADDNTKGAYEIFIGDDAYGINYHSAGAMGTRRRDFAITSAGNVGMGTNTPSFASGSGLEIERAGIATLRLQNTSGKSVEITQDSDFKIECMNSTSDIHLIPTAYVGVGTENPNSTLHVYGTGQLDLLKIERASSTPGITFVNGADTAGTFGFQLMDNDEYWAGVYDGSNYNYWFKGNSSVFRVEKPVASSTDSGTRQYSHLCTGSFYQSTGAIVIETNIPAHNASGNANMLSIKIRGYEYAIHGSIDLNVGCYAGEGQYYSANYNSNYIADGWRGNIKFAKNDTTGKMAIILGTTSTVQRCELAVVDFIQGFQNVNESYANGWSMSLKTSLSNYSQQTTMEPRMQSPRPGFHAWLSSNTNLSAGVQQVTLGSTTFNEGSYYNTSNGRFTAPTEGVYQFNFSVMMQSTSVNQTYLSAEARVNGSTRYIGGWFNKTTGGNNNNTTYAAATGSAAIKLARNDYVEFVCEISNADTAIGGAPGYTYLSGILIG